MTKLDSCVTLTDLTFLCQGLYLYKSTLAVLSVQHQTIHVFQLDKEGYFVKVGLGLRA